MTTEQEVTTNRSNWLLGIGVVALLTMIMVIGYLLWSVNGRSTVISDRLVSVLVRGKQITLQVESQVAGLEIGTDVKQDIVDDYLRRLNLYPLNEQEFVPTGSAIEDLGRIQVEILPVSRLAQDLLVDPQMDNRLIIRTADGKGGTAIGYFFGEVFENGTFLKIPVYVSDEVVVLTDDVTKRILITELVMMSVFGNFEKDKSSFETLNQDFTRLMGDFVERPIVGYLSDRFFFGFLIDKLVGKVYAACSGVLTCGTWQTPPGSCSITGTTCFNNSQCSGPGNFCSFPPPTCSGGVAPKYCGGPTCTAACGPSSCSESGGCSCSPECAGKVCGQSNTCGGSCSTSGFSTWNCGACNINPGGCGNVTLYRNCTNLCGGSQQQACGGACNECGPFGSQGCGNWTQTYNCQGSISGCTECGPYISGWTWGACTAPTFTRTATRTCSENCGSDNCAGVPLVQTEDCRGSVSGTFFDASDVSDCSTYASLPKISNVAIDLTATVNHSTVYPATTDVNGAYSRTGLPIPESYNLTYTVDDTQWVASPPKFQCDGSLTGISLSTQGQAITRRVGLYRVYGGWFQAMDGDIAAESGITVDIPSTCTIPANQASCGSFTSGGVYTPLIRSSLSAGGTGTAGVAYSNSINLGTAPSAIVSNTELNSSSIYGGRNYDYGFYSIQTTRLSRQNWDGVSEPAGDTDGEIFLSSGNVTIGADWDLGGGGTDEKLFIVHDGNITITSDLNVAPGSYLGIVASGNITFASNVANAEGVFIADNINIASTGNTATEVQFVGEGTFIGWSGVALGRDRGAGNNSAPSELFIFRPDFVVNAFDGVRAPEVRWQEVAP